jgi:hypothetical protein
VAKKSWRRAYGAAELGVATLSCLQFVTGPSPHSAIIERMAVHPVHQYPQIGVILTIFTLTATSCSDHDSTAREFAYTGALGSSTEASETETGPEAECIDCDPLISPVCGDATCEVDEDCSTCAEDCGVCLDCSEAPSCQGAAIPGLIEAHLEPLDVPLASNDAQPVELAAMLHAAVESGDPGVRIVAAALDQPSDDEHPLVAALRDVFSRHPEQAATVRRQLARAGMGAPAGYRVRFPEHGLLVDPLPLAPPPPAEAGDCDPARLRMRVAKILVHDSLDPVLRDRVYCAIVSEAASGAEIKVTPRTSKLKSGGEYVFALAEGVIWGQLGEPVAPLGDMLITYNCFESDDTRAYQQFLEAIGDAALGAGSIPGSYGWVVPVIGLAAKIIGAALALDNDDHLINVAQIIPAELQLEMTNGVWWSVERSGTHGLLKKWHWELRMEAWGCTDDALQ